MNEQKTTQNTAIIIWLFSCVGLVFTMVIVGAMTRLTDSGLSMVEWRPLMGAIPPLNEVEWARVFNLYQQSPEFEKKHFWMELRDFKMIFIWEWSHRFLGRIIGLAYALPLLSFWIKDMIPQGYKLKLLAMLILGGGQGFMGWFMVQSGLVDEPSVSHYRLAAHLTLALLIISLLLWLGLSIKGKNTKNQREHKNLYAHAWGILGILILTIFWGAYTAGLDAGLIYNDSFPKMGGHWIPSGMWQYQPFWINFFETHTGVQFIHRWLAITTVLSVLSLWLHAAKQNHKLPIIHALGIMVLLQMGLGILTLFTHVAVPIATTHQGGAVILLILLIITLHQLKPAQRP